MDLPCVKAGDYTCERKAHGNQQLVLWKTAVSLWKTQDGEQGCKTITVLSTAKPEGSGEVNQAASH
ncbi:hypothetical protein N8I74_01675 [Chitiniphilus purpureus]|uniref:Uncharacterized protein n=1 Tax=Chitiniphilus purpureus TaxID=2981137 RepID=A0ABY6DN38_9NEIS|nr:hypothetical protein [Chitiniphilus sp. CD1]UXY15751.1 hypothetical protein N8I74_01675 [Chitiniphilus sp. CD1]